MYNHLNGNLFYRQKNWANKQPFVSTEWNKPTLELEQGGQKLDR